MDLQDVTVLKEKIKNINHGDLEPLIMEVFQYQYKSNPFYKAYVDLVRKRKGEVREPNEIPFLPITFFKNYVIKSGKWDEERCFESSGTTSSTTSKHFISSLEWYFQISQRNFEAFYGDIREYCILALLPSYLERSNSSLVYMAKRFIELSRYSESGFFLYDFNKLFEKLRSLKEKKIPTIVLGVSFALLDFAEKYPYDFNEVIFMETGGMKGRRKELIREELHHILKGAFSVECIHSEYGMTELQSQAYSKEAGLFQCGPTMKVFCREINDPFSTQKAGNTGLLNVIDFANIDTCCFIATDDLGRVYESGAFEVLGRLDGSDIRGCNLMVSDL